MPDSSQHNNEAHPGGTLASRLFASAAFADFVSECKTLIQSQVNQKGVTIRTSFRMAQQAKPNLLDRTVRELLPDFVAAMEPSYADYRSRELQSFRDYLVAHDDIVARAVLSAADKRAERIQSGALRSGYGRLRGHAYREIVAAVPDIAATVARYV